MEQMGRTSIIPESNFLPEIEERQKRIDALRELGVDKIEVLKNENRNIKKNKQLEKEVREKLIAKNKEEIEKAKEVKAINAPLLKQEVKDSIAFISASYSPLIKKEKYDNKELIAEEKVTLVSKLEAAKLERDEELAKLKAEFESAPLPEDKCALKEEKNRRKLAINEVKTIYKQKVNDANVAFNDKKDELKDKVHGYYLNEFSYLEKANNKHLPLLFVPQQKYENYVYTFSLKNFFLKNGLYLAILALMIFATILYGIQMNEFLFNSEVLLLILNQVSPKMFLALGVAGLIVLAGTDLSIGRLVGMSSVLTGMLVTTSGKTSVTFLGVSPDFSVIPLPLRVILAFIVSIIACCLISGIAGFFTAKFKMHPFISTLATQLFTFGLLAGLTGNSFTGNADPTVTAIVSGKGLGGLGPDGSEDFPIMIVWAVIGILVMWFIWNKTKFGKNMFAVGGNQEAAAVSGINVFKVTMMVFILAGIYYGIGGSIYGIYTGNVRSQVGQGMEADAIAACVVGGVSFSGGVGKISGVVIGAIIFQAIVVVLPMIGITDANYQLAIKGVIILAAVTLDCVKYLKKK